MENPLNPMTHSDPLRPSFFNLDRIIQESYDVFSLQLSPLENTHLQFKAGQFNMMYGFGRGECAISISSDPKSTEHLVHTIRAVGSLTRFLTTRRVNDKIGLRGPFGTPWPIEQAHGKAVLLIAGGIGLAPLRPVVYQLLKSQKTFKSIHLLYGARSPEEQIYRKELGQWADQMCVQTTVDRSTSNWQGHVGVVTSLITQAVFSPKDTLVMMCGPEIMMHFCLLELQTLGVPKDQIYLSMERNMSCGYGHCGHCQWGPYFLCQQGPVMNYAKIEPFFFKEDL